MDSEQPQQKPNQDSSPTRIRVGIFAESQVTGEVIGIAEMMREAMLANPGKKIVSMEFLPKHLAEGDNSMILTAKLPPNTFRNPTLSPDAVPWTQMTPQQRAEFDRKQELKQSAALITQDGLDLESKPTQHKMKDYVTKRKQIVLRVLKLKAKLQARLKALREREKVLEKCISDLDDFFARAAARRQAAKEELTPEEDGV